MRRRAYPCMQVHTAFHMIPAKKYSQVYSVNAFVLLACLESIPPSSSPALIAIADWLILTRMEHYKNLNKVMSGSVLIEGD